MPTRKKDNKKNLPQESRDRAIVAPKEESSKQRLAVTKTTKTLEDHPRVNAGTTSGKKKKPKI